MFGNMYEDCVVGLLSGWSLLHSFTADLYQVNIEFVLGHECGYFTG